MRVAIPLSRHASAIARAQSMKDCAAGLIVRPCNVMIPMGLLLCAKSIGNAFTFGLLPARANTAAGRIERHRPLATRAWRAGVEDVTIAACGTGRPAAVKASRTIRPGKLSSGERTQAACIRSAS